MEFIEEFKSIMNTNGFKSVFPNCRLCTENDSKAFREQVANDRQILFSVEENEGVNDYFFYEESPKGVKIGVFSVHAVVQIWDSPEVFLKWLSEIIKKHH